MQLINKSGFSLISVIIAISILTTLSLTISQVARNSYKTKKRLNNNSEISTILFQMTQSLSSVRNCNLNFKKGNFPELKSETKLTREYTKDNIIIERIFLDTDKEKEKTGIIVKNIELLISKTDAEAIGKTYENYTSIDIHGFAELKVEFGFNSINKDTKTFKKISLKRIPLFLSLNSDYKFESCYATAFNELLKDAIADAVKKSCNFGLKFNNDIENPKCIPLSNEQDLINCPAGQYIKNLKIVNNEGEIEYIGDCSPELCQEGKVGIWYNNSMSCVKCTGSQIPIITNNGLKCRTVDCHSSGSISYLRGFDGNTGTPLCNILVEDTSSECGENGFKLVKSSSGSVSSLCCQDCPDSSNICSGILVDKTDDCNIACKGTLPRKKVQYSDWGTCSKKSGKMHCTEERTGICDKFDKNGFPCCDSGVEVKTITRQCSTGNWQFDSCPKNSLKMTSLDPICTTDCCDPSKRPLSKICSPETSNGAKFAECNAIGGVFYGYSGATFCRVVGKCPPRESNQHYPRDHPLSYKWSKAYSKYEDARGQGDAWGVCMDEDSCFARANRGWQAGPPPSCYFHAVREYIFPWCRYTHYRKEVGKTIESLCK